jgi:hypothetical protein
MSIVRHMLTAFIGGELSPFMAGRVDTQQYANGLERCENFVPINEGPIVKRPGFEFICDADASSTWLGAFRFSIDQEYVIEWGEAKARFYTNGVRIETGPGVAYEIITPYSAAIASMLSTQQSYDRLYIDHADHPPAAIVRTAATTFAHAPSVLVNGPFLDQNIDEAIGVTISGTTGSVTISSTAPIFAASNVGALFRAEALDFSDIKAWEAGMKGVIVGDVVRNEGKAYAAATAGVTGTSPPIHVGGSEWDGQGKKDELNDKGPFGVRWLFLHERYGTATITGFTSATQVTATVIKRMPSSLLTVPSWRWSHAAFSATRGWPSLVANWAGRQVHIKDFDIVASVVGDYGGGRVNFATLTSAGNVAPDLAFRRTLALDNPPLWLAVDRKALLLGTADGEVSVVPTNAAQSVSGDNISADPQSYFGSERVWPAKIGTDVMFVERGGRRLRASGFDLGRDRYAAIDLTAAARHITRSGVTQLAYQRVPFALLYGVRGDGQMVVHPDTRIEVKGFARIVAGGSAQILSAVSVVGADGKTDELWALVSRVTPSGTRREIWRQTAWRDVGDAREESFFVDAGVRVAAAGGQTNFTGAIHLAGQTVAVLANGGVVPGVVVANDGSFSLPATSVPPTPYVMIVGLPYSAIAVTMRPAVSINGQPAQALRQRLVKLAARLLETLGLKVAGTVDGPFDELIDRPGNSQMDRAIPLFTGDIDTPVDTAFDREGRAVFLSDQPLPAIVTAAMMNIDVDMRDV